MNPNYCVVKGCEHPKNVDDNYFCHFHREEWREFCNGWLGQDVQTSEQTVKELFFNFTGGATLNEN